MSDFLSTFKHVSLTFPNTQVLSADFPNYDFCTFHYANMPMQNIAIFHGCKNGNFSVEKCDIFLTFAQNIDCGYTLGPPQLGGSNEYPLSIF